MANVRINSFENISNIQFITHTVHSQITRCFFQYVYIPGSISFNNIGVILSGSGAVSENLSISFGLYSLTGNTFSLANSASVGTGLTLNQTMFSWLTLATSATQDITPGEWWFAFMSSTTLGGGFSIFDNQQISGGADLDDGAYGGPFFRGFVNTSALPSSIATNDVVNKEGAALYQDGDAQYPYILISA